MVGNCLIPNKNKINWLDGLDDNTFRELVHPLYERIATVASKICNMEFHDFDVKRFDDTWDIVGIKQNYVQFNLFDVDVFVQSDGCWHYNKNGDSLPLNIVVDYWNTSGVDKIDLPDKYNKFVIMSNNHITINIPENDYENGLNAAVAVKHYITSIE